MARYKNTIWNLMDNPDIGHAQLGVLMDIRDELQNINRILYCKNFIAIPTILRGISRKLPTQKPAKRGKKS